MNESDDNVGLVAARGSLALFILGLLLPIVGTCLASGHLIDWQFPEAPARIAPSVRLAYFWLGAVAELIALILGIWGRRHVSGQVGMVGSILSPVLVVFLLLDIIHLVFLIDRLFGG